MRLNMSLRRVILFFLLSVSGWTFLPARGHKEVHYKGDSFTPVTVLTVREQIQPLYSQASGYKQATLDFFSHYGADEIPGTIQFGTFQSGGLKMAAYIFKPTGDVSSKGTVYLLHGYLDHTLSNTLLIRTLVANHYTVAAFDLPGHGFSEGKTADIDDFNEYALHFRRFLNITEGALPPPFHFLGHSTGCSVYMEYLTMYDNDFGAVIFVSPLVKSWGWRLTPLGLALTGSFKDEVGRRFGVSSSNKDLGNFVEYHDPLQSRTVPYHWVYSYMDWSKRMELTEPRESPVLHILQGRKDRVVDYRYNIPFLLEKYPRSDVKYYTDGEHSLFNEPPLIRDEVFQDILNLLESTDDIR